ncbi:hypothetical protein F442_04401, partial [Phytophthora nicotianae P10297]
QAVVESSPDNQCTNLEQSDYTFREFKPTLESLFRKLDGSQSYQIFQMRVDEPGKVYCRKRPGSRALCRTF